MRAFTWVKEISRTEVKFILKFFLQSINCQDFFSHQTSRALHLFTLRDRRLERLVPLPSHLLALLTSTTTRNAKLECCLTVYCDVTSQPDIRPRPAGNCSTLLLWHFSSWSCYCSLVERNNPRAPHNPGCQVQMTEGMYRWMIALIQSLSHY